MERVNRRQRRRYYEARSKEKLQQYLIQLYNQGHTENEIAKLIDIPRGTVSRWMIEIGLKGRPCGEAGKVKSKRYRYDENFFATIDTPDKAYIVGFINGDGYIVDRGKSKRMGIVLSIADRQILEDIALYMEMQDMLKFHKATYSNEQMKASLIINCTKICDDLIRLGISPQKTGKEQWLNFNRQDLQWAFIRGIFDADGHIYDHRSQRRWRKRFGITGSQALLNDILLFFKSKEIALGINGLYKKQGCYDLHITSQKDLCRIYNEMYAYGTLKLNRKYEKFTSLMI
ncbi:helix-turn-helix domain-containing protein [Aneurinibacillus sp. REN35]|uniref:helix-turn-helix domain-containing protein n=1 Tax=Aneurinibacillus sp. REN35 TaxID=3237286 RepID=UPI003528EBB6